MAERFTRTILSFLAVLAVYWLYALLVVPRIDPLGDPLNAMNPAAVPARSIRLRHRK